MLTKEKIPKNPREQVPKATQEPRAEEHSGQRGRTRDPAPSQSRRSERAEGEDQRLQLHPRAEEQSGQSRRTRASSSTPEQKTRAHREEDQRLQLHPRLTLEL